MKSQGILLRFWVLTLLFSVALTTCAQQPKKKENAASSKVETTYKPLKKNAADKGTAAKKKNTAKRTEQGTVQAKNAAKTTASKKQAAGRGKAQAQGREKNKDKKIVKGEKQVQVKGNKQAGKPAPSAEAKAAAKRPVQAKEKQQQQKRQQQKKQQPKPKRYVALKSNIPFQALSMHNLAVEVQVHKHLTVDFPVMWSISDIEREHAVRGIAFQPEGRWWLKKAGTGHFFGIHAHAAWFNLMWEDNRYQTDKRPLLGAGISYGYKLPLSAHWGAEFNIGAGYANMKYDTFYNVENGAQLDTRIRHYWGITRVGISLVYRF